MTDYSGRGSSLVSELETYYEDDFGSINTLLQNRLTYDNFLVYRVSQKLSLILRLSFGAMNFSVANILVLSDSRDMYK